MVRSMAVVLAVVALVVVVAWRPHPDPVTVVDPAPIASMAVAQAEFLVAIPRSLPPGWRPTSARWEPTAESGSDPVLHIGYVTPSEQYAQVSQSTAHDGPYLAEQTARAVRQGQLDVAGTTWETWGGGDRRSLVRTDGGVTTIVSGSAPWEELAVLAAALRPAGS
jgi:hypothetical protein